jgi:hypothetical protein
VYFLSSIKSIDFSVTTGRKMISCASIMPIPPQFS